MNTKKKAIQSYTNSIINIYPDLSQEELSYILSKVTVTELDNRKFYLNAGEVQPSIGFVYKGLLRSYYIDKNGKEITISFIKENSYASDYSAFLTKKPSKFYIQALEPCVFVNLTYLSMQECYSEYKNFEKYGRLIAENILPENGALQLLIRANENQEKPYFLILDKMNLSHVERYFADFLSVMESKDKFKLHSDTENKKSGVPHELDWPKNLFVVGTVNIDETTYMFSPKVLDRANVIEFRVNETEIKDFLNAGKEITSIAKMGAAMGNSFVDIAENNKNEGDFNNLNIELLEFFAALQKLGSEFGYRTASEIQTLFSKIDLVNPAYSDKENEKIDIAIMQKLLPKLHGSRRKLLKTLNLLAQKCLSKEQEIIFNERGVYTISEDNEIKYNLSFEKIARMYKNAIENGFASYAEA